jgi:RNA polymerase sigma-70 factor (ECF subfamily)
VAPSALEAESLETLRGFLANQPGAIDRVSGWARAVAARHPCALETVDDLVQAALLCLLQNLRRGAFRGPELAPYVRGIARNLCVDQRRREAVRRCLVPLDEERLPPRPDRNGPSPAERLDSRIEAARILAALDRPCREILVLAYLRGLSRREIAGQLGISEVAARVRVHRSLRRARRVAERRMQRKKKPPGADSRRLI